MTPFSVPIRKSGLILSANLRRLVDVGEGLTGFFGRTHWFLWKDSLVSMEGLTGFFGILWISSIEVNHVNELLVFILPMRSVKRLPFTDLTFQS